MAELPGQPFPIELLGQSGNFQFYLVGEGLKRQN